MIDLLPPEEKRQIRAGLSNSLLFRYCVASLLLAVPLVLLAGGSYLVIIGSKNTAEATIRDSQAKSAEYADIQTQAQEFKNNLSTAKSILDKEVKYSKIAIAIAQNLPAGISLDTLNLDSQNFSQPLTLQLHGDTYDDAIRYKKLLEGSPLFQDVHLQSVTASAEGGGVTIAISTVMNPEAIR